MPSADESLARPPRTLTVASFDGSERGVRSIPANAPGDDQMRMYAAAWAYTPSPPKRRFFRLRLTR